MTLFMNINKAKEVYIDVNTWSKDINIFSFVVMHAQTCIEKDNYENQGRIQTLWNRGVPAGVPQKGRGVARSLLTIFVNLTRENDKFCTLSPPLKIYNDRKNLLVQNNAEDVL